MSARCPICSGDVFQPYNGRAGAQCASCKSLERGRLLWMAMQKLDVLRPGLRILHLAPERFLMERLSSLSGALYHACDFDPSRYRMKGVHVFQVDACVDLAKLPSSSFDLVIHNHVLEHVPCSVELVLGEMVRVMADGAHMLFSVPFRGAHTDEDLSPTLSAEERKARFAQGDHLRIFGTKDFPALLERVLSVKDPVFPFSAHFTQEELAAAAVPASPDTRIGGNTIFAYRKPGGPEAMTSASARPTRTPSNTSV